MSWFPGGTRLLISGAAGPGISGMWTVATIGGELRKVQDNVGQAALSPDGSRIVFERQHELWQMGPNGENPERLFEVPSSLQVADHAGYLNCSNLSFSPDGRWITYVHKLSETDPLVLEARLLEDGRIATILKYPDLRNYSWLSSNKIVLDRWEAPDQPFSNLWQIDVDPKKMKADGRPRRLTNWAGFAVETMSASRDGKLLSATRRMDQSYILVGKLADAANNLADLHRISLEDRIEWPGGWSGDSKALLFQSNRTGNMNIFRQRVDATNAEPVIMDHNDSWAPLVSPDKQWVLYFTWSRSTAHVNTASLMRKPLAEDGTPELILEAKGSVGSGQTFYHSGSVGRSRVLIPAMTGHPAFRCPSRPNTSCVLSEAGPRETVFYSFAPIPATAKTEIFRVPVEDPEALAWDLSPDGSQIAYSEYNWRSASIHIREVSGSTVRDIPIKGLPELTTLTWSADSNSFFVTNYRHTESSLFHVTLDGRYHVLYKGAKEVEGPRVSPDGHYLAFGDVRSASNVWLVEGFPN